MVIRPFCKGFRSKNVMQPCLVSAWCKANAFYSSVNLDFFMAKLLSVVSPVFSSSQISNLFGGVQNLSITFKF